MPSTRMIQSLTVIGLIAVLSTSVMAQDPKSDRKGEANEVFNQQKELIEKLRKAKAAQNAPIKIEVLPAVPRVDGEAGQQDLEAESHASKWPGRLHVNVDFLKHRGVVRVLLKDVFAGGVADSMGLRRGEIIIGVNHRLIRSEQEFRRSIFGSVAPVFHVQSPNGQVRVVEYVSIDPVVYFAGVNGHLDHRNEFVVDYIAPHDPLTRHLKLRRGDKILAAGGYPIESIPQLMSIVQPNQGKMAIVVLRDGQTDPEVIWITL